MNKTIEEILAELPLDDKAVASLTEAWNKSLADAKIVQEAEINKANEVRYAGDLEKIHEAFGLFLEERIKPHVEELQEGVEAVEGMKSRYAAKTAKIKEAAADYVRRRLGAIEQVIDNKVRDELSELHEDVVANRRAALQAVTEAETKLEMDRQKFRAKAASVLENIINVKVPKQLEPLREDIEAARQDNFGREVFEAFQTLFRRQFFNTSSEFKKLLSENKSLKETNETVKHKAAKAIKESREEAIAAKRAFGKLNESVIREQNMARLLKPLTGTPRAQMKALLEATKTDKMDATFRKALPQIVRENKHSKPAGKAKVLREGKDVVKAVEFRSGGTDTLRESDYDDFDDDIAEIKRRAGN